MLDLSVNKTHDENRQGEAFAPFVADGNAYRRRFYIESYGCQMNFSDSEIVASILNSEGFGATRNYEEADLILLNTCSIREKAELTVRKRLTEWACNSTGFLITGLRAVTGIAYGWETTASFIRLISRRIVYTCSAWGIAATCTRIKP